MNGELNIFNEIFGFPKSFLSSSFWRTGRGMLSRFTGIVFLFCIIAYAVCLCYLELEFILRIVFCCNKIVLDIRMVVFSTILLIKIVVFIRLIAQESFLDHNDLFILIQIIDNFTVKSVEGIS